MGKSTYRLIIFFLIMGYNIISPQSVYTATYYVSPSGSNTTGNGSSAAPWQTITYATGKMVGGDTLILKDGVYYNINGENSIIPPSGSSGNYTIIKAQNNFGAIINGSQWTQSYHLLITISNKSYIQIEGLKIRDISGLGNSSILISNSDHIKILKTSIRNGVPFDFNYGNPIEIAGASHHVLLEDIWVTGTMRYGILIFKPESTGAPGVHTEKIILRRVIVRQDYISSNQPLGGIAFYGRESGTTEDTPSVKNILCQNCVVLDLNYGGKAWNYGDPAPAWRIYGAFYNPKITENISYYGSIALNIKGDISVGGEGIFDGFYISDNYTGNTGHNFINSVAYDITGNGIRFDHGKINGAGLVDQSLIGKSLKAVDDTTPESNMVVSVKNSIFLNNTNANSGVDVSAYNTYIPGSQAQGTNYSTNNPNLLYITRTTDLGTGENGVKRGATIETRYGVSGTLWDEPGFDQLTSDSLWPWPYENQIKADFSEPNDPPTGAYPPTNNTKRGFCADGMTLTTYIWEYLGNPTPPEIRPSPPPNVKVTLP